MQDLVDNSSEIDDEDLKNIDLESDKDSVSDFVSASENSENSDDKENAAIREAVDLDQPQI